MAASFSILVAPEYISMLCNEKHVAERVCTCVAVIGRPRAALQETSEAGLGISNFLEAASQDGVLNHDHADEAFCLQTSMQQSFRSLSRLPLIYRSRCPTVVIRSSCRALAFTTPSTAAPSSKLKLDIPNRTFASVMTQVHRVTDDLEKPALDDRSYRVITLPNKLEALLVHDPDTDKASASLNVNVGSFSDEDDMPGMAHAVEHALFMGTKKVCL